MNDLYIIAINLTRRCNLACAHCYMDADTRLDGGEGELSTAELKGLLEQIAERSSETMVVLTGGEPLLRKDLDALVAHGSGLGLSMVVGSNGVLLDEQRVAALKQAGLMGLGISLDSLDPAYHDGFRGCPGSWERTLAGMEACRRHALPFQVHFSVTEQNAHELRPMIDFARAVGAHVLNVFFLVCTGRGESMSDIAPERYEQALHELIEAQENSRDLIIRARCAPYYKRIAYQRDPESRLTRAQGYEGGGCLAGSHYCRITPEGAVTACPYIEQAEGNIRETPFWEIWDLAPAFGQLRAPTLAGKCGACEFRQLCGGCRARPKALGAGLMDADPWCAYQPQDGVVIQPLREGPPAEVAWSPEARERLQRVPGFLRKMVRKRAEDHVRERGEREVTGQHLATLAARRFGDAFPGQPPKQPISPPTSNSIAWEAGALTRLQSAPEFIRTGIRKAAEFNARSEGLAQIGSEDLTRYRNQAMQRAVRRMKGFGMQELSFAAWDIAKERVPRLKDNEQAAQRFAAIREHVQSQQTPEGGLGLLDRELLEKMKAELKK